MRRISGEWRGCFTTSITSGIRKYKTPSFAAGCSREVIARGAEMLGWDLDTLLVRTLDAMKRCEQDIAAAETAAF